MHTEAGDMVPRVVIFACGVSSADLPPAWQAVAVLVGVLVGIGAVELAVWRKRNAAARRRRRAWRERRRHH